MGVNGKGGHIGNVGRWSEWNDLVPFGVWMVAVDGKVGDPLGVWTVE